MDMSRVYSVLALVFAAMCVVTRGMSLPSGDMKDAAVQLDGSAENGLDEGRRASWLETRDLEESFKDLVLLTLQELASEGRIDPRVIASDVEQEGMEGGESVQKRGRWQGFCFRRTKTGRYLPYICWKGDRK